MRREAAKQGFKGRVLFQITSRPSWIFWPRERQHPKPAGRRGRRDPRTRRLEERVTRSPARPRGGRSSKGSQAFRIQIPISAWSRPNQLQQRFVLCHPLAPRGDRGVRRRSFWQTKAGLRQSLLCAAVSAVRCGEGGSGTRIDPRLLVWSHRSEQPPYPCHSGAFYANWVFPVYAEIRDSLLDYAFPPEIQAGRRR